MSKLNEKEMKLVEDAVEYNHNLIESADGYVDEVIDDLIAFSDGIGVIFDPLHDFTMRVEVDPVEEYGEDSIREFIEMYKNEVDES